MEADVQCTTVFTFLHKCQKLKIRRDARSLKKVVGSVATIDWLTIDVNSNFERTIMAVLRNLGEDKSFQETSLGIPFLLYFGEPQNST